MLRKNLAPNRARTDSSNPPPQTLSRDPRALAPDDLRNQVQRTLLALCEEDRRVWRRRLLTGLVRAGVHLGTDLFMLGIVASNLDELTPSDVAVLLRYIRINAPAAFEALSGPLSELLVVNEAALAAGRGREAA